MRDGAYAAIELAFNTVKRAFDAFIRDKRRWTPDRYRQPQSRLASCAPIYSV